MGPQVKQVGAKMTSRATEFRDSGHCLCLELTFFLNFLNFLDFHQEI